MGLTLTTEAGGGGGLPRSRWSAWRTSVALTMVALVLWSYSITQARFEIGFYGLVGGFPALFFVALGILTIASAVLWLSREDHGGLLLLQLCFLIAALWLAPLMVRGGTPIQQESYTDLGRMEYICRQGHISPTLLWEQAWPGGWIFWAIVTLVPGIGTDGLAKAIPWIPFIWQVALLLPLFVFFRNTIGKSSTNLCWAAMWVFYVGSWSVELDTGAHAFGAFLVFGTLALLTMQRHWGQGTAEAGYRMSANILFGAAAVAHLLGSLVTLGTTAALAAFRRVGAWSVLVVAVLVAAWSAFGAADFFGTQGSAYLKGIFKLQLVARTTFEISSSGSASRAAVATVRIITTGVFGVLALAGGEWGWRYKRSPYADVSVVAIVAACVPILIVLGTVYGTALFQRLLLFLMPAIAYFTVKLLYSRWTAALVLALLLPALPLMFISMYGNQAIDYLSPAYINGANLFQDKTDHGLVTGYLPIGRLKNQESYLFVGYEQLESEGNSVVYSRALDLMDLRYVCISNADRARYTFYWNQPDFIDDMDSRLEAANNWRLVYSNPDVKLYLNSGP